MTYLLSSASAIITDRNNWHTSSDTWQARANQAWGPSRTWNSGVSFESQYNQSQTDLANMTTDRNTWQGRANNAWGPSRVWNSGESWEQAYNRVLPAALWQFQASTGATLTGSDQIFHSRAVPYTGQYVLTMTANMGDGADGAWGYFEIRRNGGNIAAAMARFRVGGVTSTPGAYWVGALNANDTISIMGRAGGASGPVTALAVAYTFVPTPAQPH